MARIRGVASESATAALAERGLIEEAGRSPFGAVLYRTTPLFLKLFGLRSLEELPELEQWDPSPEDQAALRDRLLRAGDERTGRRQQRGGTASPSGLVTGFASRRQLPAGRVDVAAAGEADRRAQAVLLERGLERVDRAARASRRRPSPSGCTGSG